MSSIGDKISETVAIPAIAGVIGWAGSKFALNQTGTYNLYGQNIDVNLLNGGVVAVGTFAGEFTKDFVIDYIPLPDNLKTFGQMAVPPVMAGTGVAAVEYALSGQLQPRMFVLGAASQIGATYAWDAIKGFL
jgi:hypothetical protein